MLINDRWVFWSDLIFPRRSGVRNHFLVHSKPPTVQSLSIHETWLCQLFFLLRWSCSVAVSAGRPCAVPSAEHRPDVLIDQSYVTVSLFLQFDEAVFQPRLFDAVGDLGAAYADSVKSLPNIKRCRSQSSCWRSRCRHRAPTEIKKIHRFHYDHKLMIGIERPDYDYHDHHQLKLSKLKLLTLCDLCLQLRRWE